MAYSDINFPSKKALKEAVKAWIEGTGPRVGAYSPGTFPLTAGRTTIEGPHFPQPHKWYASVMIQDIEGNLIITKVIS
jgi:hypothetical protein